MSVVRAEAELAAVLLVELLVAIADEDAHETDAPPTTTEPVATAA